MNATPISIVLPPELVDELLDLMSGSPNEPSDELWDKISDASGRSKTELRNELHEKRNQFMTSLADHYGAMGAVTKG